MNRTSLPRRLLSLLLAAVLCACMIPRPVIGTETSEPWAQVDRKYDIYEQITAPENGDTVVIYNPGSGKMLSSADSGYYKAGTDAAAAGEGYLASDDDAVAWKVRVDEQGHLYFTQGGLKLGMEKDGNYVNLTTNAGDHGFVLSPFVQGGDLYRIRSATVETEFGASYLEWYAAKGVFAAYSTGEAHATQRNFGFRFYKLVREGTEEEIPTEPSEPAESTEPSESTEPTEPTKPSEPTEPTEPSDPTEPTEPSVPTEPTEPTEPTQPELPDVPAVTAIADGDYVIWAPEYCKALSGIYSGYYNSGVTVTPEGDILSGYHDTEIWTVKNREDGTLTISMDGRELAMDDAYSSMTLDGKHTAWILEDAGNGRYYVKNTGRNAYMQWYAEKQYWSAYHTVTEGSEGRFALLFTPAVRGYTTDPRAESVISRWGGMTSGENTAFIPGDRYVSGDEADTEAIFTAVVSGKTVTPWTKGGTADAPLYYMGAAGMGSGTGDHLQLRLNAAGWGHMTLSFRLRSSNTGPGSFQLKYSTDGGATWRDFSTGTYAYAYTGWNSEGSYPVTGSGNITDGIARTSYAPGNYVSFLFDVPAGADNCGDLLIRLVPGRERARGEGAIGAASTVRLDSVVLSGSPIVDRRITGFVSVTPDGRTDLPLGTVLTMTSATEGAVIFYRVNGGGWQIYDETGKPALHTLPCVIETYAAAEGRADSVVRLFRYTAGTVRPVKFSPNGGGICIGDRSAEIVLSTDTEGACIYFATSGDGITFSEFTPYTGPIPVEKGFGKLFIRAYAAKEGFRDSEVTVRNFTERESDGYQLFFGQLHAHTSISDGIGTVEEAFQYASRVENLDFLAITDHSNSFDAEASGVLSQDGSAVSSEWKQGHEAAAAVTCGDFVGLYGFEMTWSNGLGHINTFNTPGWQSRTQADYKNKDNALQNYYGALATVPESISQFNHPGTTFGDFSDFAHYSPETDALITLIEVGNGEGAVGSAGYFPSYEYYTRALDRGWHLAPTNNQDNHNGRWGDANTCRSAVLAYALTPEGIYDALRNYRVYATEDSDLQIFYTLNGHIMGSILEDAAVGEEVNLRIDLSDATDRSVGKVEVIVNGGETAASQTLDTPSGTVTLAVPALYSYYYIRVTQPDGDTAVTAPVWVGDAVSLGISGLKTGSLLTVAGREQTFTAELFNNETRDLLVESLVYTNKATGEVLFTDTDITLLRRESTAVSSFGYTFPDDGVYTVTATLKGTLDGIPMTCTRDLEVTVMPRGISGLIIVDGTHGNDYVTGYYGGNMNNIAAIAARRGIQVHVEKDAITPKMLENCALLIISAPAKGSGTGSAGNYAPKPFEDDFLATVADYVRSGGSVAVCGLSDYRDKDAAYGPGGHTAAQLNRLLTAIGSTMRIHDDEARDDVSNGGQTYRLYSDIFNRESPWCAGIRSGQLYSQYSGCTVDPGEGTWLVKGLDTTCSIDSDGDGIGGVQKGEAYLLAAEETGFGGSIFAAGGVFLSDFEVKAETDSSWELPLANRVIFENIIGSPRFAPEITPIAAVRASAREDPGRIFAVEGYVTAGTNNVFTTFPDTVYIQDETGGIALLPYSETGLAAGTKVRVTGYTAAHRGEIELQILSLEILPDPLREIPPEKVTPGEAMDYAANGGRLLLVEGTVTDVILTSDGRGAVRFTLRDALGGEVVVFIGDHIRSATTGENQLAGILQEGNTVSAVGLGYLHPEEDPRENVAVLRVRNCDEILLIREKQADKTALAEAMKEAAAKNREDYSDRTWNALQAALKVAQSVMEDENATQEEIDAALAALNAAIRALAPPTGNSETSDGTPAELYLALMAVSLPALAALLLNRKRFAG